MLKVRSIARQLMAASVPISAAGILFVDHGYSAHARNIAMKFATELTAKGTAEIFMEVWRKERWRDGWTEVDAQTPGLRWAQAYRDCAILALRDPRNARTEIIAMLDA